MTNLSKRTIATAIAVVALLAIFLFFRTDTGGEARPASAIEAAVIKDCFEKAEFFGEGERFRCMRGYLEKMIVGEGRVIEAQNILDGIRKRGFLDISQCHNVAHALGKAAVRAGSLREALDSSVPSCDWGFVHGAFQAWFLMRGGRNIEDFSRFGGEACRSSSPVESNQIYRERCFHGLGHGLAEYNPKDIYTPLTACDLSSHDDNDKRSCYAGVFMQLARPNDENLEPFFYRRNEPFYPCNIVAEKYQMACYADVSHRAISEKMPYGEVASLCEKIPGEEIRKNCIAQIYGTIAYSQTSFEQKRDECRGLPDSYPITCFAVVARNLADNPQDFGADAPVRFCESNLTTNEAEECLKGVDSRKE